MKIPPTVLSMMSLFRSFVSLCLLLGLTACGPVYKTEYSFSAPQTIEGKNCANHCLDARHACLDSCAAKEQTCRENAKIDAKIAYLEYLSTKIAREEEANKTMSDFESYSHCSPTKCEKQCEESQRICHVNCGGGVTERKYCTAFCD